MKRDMERSAEQLLAHHGYNGFPVNVEELAATMGIVVTYERFEPNLSGMLLREPGRSPIIGVNNRQSPRRQRFTIAHELGHHEWHEGQLIVDTGARFSLRDERSASATINEEREANAFAAALLMPALLVEEEVRLFKSRQLAQSARPAELARRFNVSEEAMTYRLVNLGF